jgi:cell division protein FtsQ
LVYSGDQAKIRGEAFGKALEFIQDDLKKTTQTFHTSVSMFKEENMSKKEFFERAKIHEDAFLDALIDQIYVTKHQELILTPKVGVRKIFFGKAKNIDEKLFNLKAFYLHGKSKIDWQKYSSINIKYRNQIVCSKK